MTQQQKDKITRFVFAATLLILVVIYTLPSDNLDKSNNSSSDPNKKRDTMDSDVFNALSASEKQEYLDYIQNLNAKCNYHKKVLHQVEEKSKFSNQKPEPEHEKVSEKSTFAEPEPASKPVYSETKPETEHAFSETIPEQSEQKLEKSASKPEPELEKSTIKAGLAMDDQDVSLINEDRVPNEDEKYCLLCNNIIKKYPPVRKLCQECKAQAKEHGLSQRDYIAMMEG